MLDTYWRFIVRYLYFLAVVTEFPTVAVPTPDPCPWQCTCSQPLLTGSEVSCNGRDLKIIPAFPHNSATIDISGNKLTKIPANLFPRFLRLHSLWLDNNKISFVEPFAFRSMENLEVLSIRNNKEWSYISKFAFSGLRHVHRLILTDNSISWIEKNAFYATAYVDTIALYGNPITELRLSAFNNLKHIKHFRLPVGISSMVSGSFAGLSFVQDLTLEGLNITQFRPDTFFNLTDVTRLRVHDSIIHSLMTLRPFAGMERIDTVIFGRCTIGDIGPQMFEEFDPVTRIQFERNNFSKIQKGFPSALEKVADFVEFHENDADCCEINSDHLQHWQQSARKSPVVTEFLHGISCIGPKWVFEESLLTVDLTRLRNACSGALDRQLQAELRARETQRPALSELYKVKNSCTPSLTHMFSIFPLFACTSLWSWTLLNL